MLITHVRGWHTNALLLVLFSPKQISGFTYCILGARCVLYNWHVVVLGILIGDGVFDSCASWQLAI